MAKSCNITVKEIYNARYNDHSHYGCAYCGNPDAEMDEDGILFCDNECYCMYVYEKELDG